MEIILCALHCEAKPLIDHFNLVKVENANTEQINNSKLAKTDVTNRDCSNTKIPCCYTNSDCTIILFEIGVGPKNASKNTSKIFEETDTTFAGNINFRSLKDITQDAIQKNTIHIYNVGACAGPTVGKQYFAAKIIDQNTNDIFYPDMPGQAYFETCTLITVDKPLQKNDIKNKNKTCIKVCSNSNLNTQTAHFSDTCYDMEASAIVKVAQKYVSPEQISIIKCVSDVGITKNPEKKYLSDLEKLITQTMSDVAPKLEQLIDKHRQQSSRCVNNNLQDTTDTRQSWNQLCKELKCSETASIQLVQKLKYCQLAGIDSKYFFNKLRNNGNIPPSNKQQTSTIIQKFQEYIDDH